MGYPRTHRHPPSKGRLLRHDAPSHGLSSGLAAHHALSRRGRDKRSKNAGRSHGNSGGLSQTLEKASCAAEVYSGRNSIQRGQAVVVCGSVYSCFFVTRCRWGINTPKQVRGSTRNIAGYYVSAQPLCTGVVFPADWHASHAQKKGAAMMALDSLSRIARPELASVYYLPRKAAMGEMRSLN